MRNRIDFVSVVLFLLTVAYFVAAAKGHGGGNGQLGKGFFNGG